MRIPNGGIAFFDSGIGGLTVLSACINQFQDEFFYYYGDNKHAPYGNLTEKKIKKYTMRAFKFFARKKVKAVVIACNTVTAICVEELRRKYAFPIVGAEPALMEALRVLHSSKTFVNAPSKGLKEENQKECIYVLVTRGTYMSERFRRLYDRGTQIYPQAEIKVFSCDRLAGMIERNAENGEFDYREFLPKGNPQTVVLGCTHYIYIKKQIEAYYNCCCIDGNNAIARRLAEVLREREENSAAIGEIFANTEENKKNRIPVTTVDPKRKRGFKNKILHNKTKTNKCSHFLQKSSISLLYKRGKNTICFCGSGKRRNALFYKQMFVSEGILGENS